eukprot:CAMPEP_0182433450 /NCGR_PEP_ID=MMETSP1167-20130531/63318_1 /TAXON_ID=2988 /ORGANISM="Mallomonas Sp, Strain CCMP3275" /LENGTH=358 /DNA_ID=CAMNT_0024622157 /DNA_START=351 /DNA_END=1427 /DNA_ORIENTATION=+
MNSLSLQKQIITDYSDSYVFDLDISKVDLSVFASLSNNSISRYDATTLELIRSVSVHTDRINSFETSSINENIIFTASSDMTVCMWDWRTDCTSPTVRLTLPDEVSCVSVGKNELLIGAACGQSLLFFDVRHGNSSLPLAEYSDCHHDTVTVLKFCPHNLSTVVSGGEDGLVCVFDTSVMADQSAVKSMFCTESPVRKLGFFGPSAEGMLCLSSIETASAWHYPTSQRVGNYPNVRVDVAADYLVDSWYDEQTDTLQILAGDYAGNAKICTVDPLRVRAVSVLSGGHRELIRCTRRRSSTNSSQNTVLFTGGEDSRICVWSASDSQLTSSNSTVRQNSKTMASPPSEQKYTDLRFKPY